MISRIFIFSSSLLAILGLAISPALAALVVTTDFKNNGTATLTPTYTVSNTDLLHGLTPVFTGPATLTEGSGTTASPAVLNDGLFPATMGYQGTFPASETAMPYSSFIVGGNNAGAVKTVTYTLAAASNISAINVYGGWRDNGRDQQFYEVSYALAGDPNTFIPLTSVNFNPGGTPTATPVATMSTIFDNSATYLLTNVVKVQFNFNLGVENGYTGYAEIDVLGTAVVPEPSTWAMLGLGAMGLVGLIRQRRRAK